MQMNYLAHAYLSFGHPEILTGNMISDYVKGKKKFDFSPAIQSGISLHRAIDQFTDEHPVTREAKTLFSRDYRLYSGAFIDVVFDHFLATDENEFNEEKILHDFTQVTYEKLELYHPVFPERFSKMFPYMKQQNWLLNYRNNWGLKKSFEGLVHRAAYLDESQTAYDLFEKHYDVLKKHYQDFFPELKSFSTQKFAELHVQL
jgi:acyl carrier protein phosphodiesterase